jgi:N-acetylglucosamine malate deacetylase 1
VIESLQFFRSESFRRKTNTLWSASDASAPRQSDFADRWRIVVCFSARQIRMGGNDLMRLRITRRELLARTAKLGCASTLVASSGPLLALPHQAAHEDKRLKIVVTGGHPGDPECGCGGTIARYTDAGHEAILLYLNRGEGYCGQSDLKDCARIRTAEAQKACEILKAKGVFATQYDGRAIVDSLHYEDFARLLLEQKPDVVFTHWPMDAHRDHRAMAALVLDAWLNSKKSFALYYYEVAEDTLLFSATDFVDTTEVAARHRAACYAHASQHPDKWFPLQMEIARYHGLQNGCAQAEAFFRVSQQQARTLP